MATVTCHTEGCGNAEIPIELALTADLDGEVVAAVVVHCGVCGQEITDIADDEREEAS